VRTSIFIGDITDALTEALCVSTNPRLSLVMGTGAAVRGRGGFGILRACEEIVRSLGALPAGSVHGTTAGTLPHKLIIHCVASDTRHRSSDTIIEACVRNALACAEAAGSRSVAMPVFASGHARVKLAHALKVMAAAVRQSSSAIDHVVFVLRDPDQANEAQAIVSAAMGGEVAVVRSPLSEPPSFWGSDDDDRYRPT
jgi:O-acetyl-ADP-ribose deacetylase (regulator of RNase III)